MIKKLMARPVGPDWRPSGKQLHLVLGTVLYAGLFHLPHVFLLLSGLFLLTLGWRKWASFNLKKLPSPRIRLGATVLLLGPMLWYLPQMDSLKVSSSFLLALTTVKLMETQQRRDWLVLLFIALAVLFIGALRSQAPLSALYLAGGVLLCTAGLVSLHEPTQSPTWRKSGALFLQALPLTVLLFMFFPRSSDPMWEFIAERAPQQTQMHAVDQLNDAESPWTKLLGNLKRWWSSNVKGFDITNQQSLYEQFGVSPSGPTPVQLFGAGVVLLLALTIAWAWLQARKRRRKLDVSGQLHHQLSQTLWRTRGLQRLPQESPVRFLERVKESEPELKPSLDTIQHAFTAIRYRPNPQPVHVQTLRRSIRKLRYHLWCWYGYRACFAKPKNSPGEYSDERSH